MLFIFRKLRRSFFLPGKVKTYVAYAVGEIALIVVGILLAMQVSGWREERQLREREGVYLDRISVELDGSIGRYSELIVSLEASLEAVDHVARSLREGKIIDDNRELFERGLIECDILPPLSAPVPI